MEEMVREAMGVSGCSEEMVRAVFGVFSAPGMGVCEREEALEGMSFPEGCSAWVSCEAEGCGCCFFRMWHLEGPSGEFTWE